MYATPEKGLFGNDSLRNGLLRNRSLQNLITNKLANFRKWAKSKIGQFEKRLRKRCYFEKSDYFGNGSLRNQSIRTLVTSKLGPSRTWSIRKRTSLDNGPFRKKTTSKFIIKFSKMDHFENVSVWSRPTSENRSLRNWVNSELSHFGIGSLRNRSLWKVTSKSLYQFLLLLARKIFFNSRGYLSWERNWILKTWQKFVQLNIWSNTNGYFWSVRSDSIIIHV